MAPYWREIWLEKDSECVDCRRAYDKNVSTAYAGIGS